MVIGDRLRELREENNTLEHYPDALAANDQVLKETPHPSNPNGAAFL